MCSLTGARAPFWIGALGIVAGLPSCTRARPEPSPLTRTASAVRSTAPAPSPPPSARPEAGPPPHPEWLPGGDGAVAAQHGLVVAGEAEAARAGARVLKRGGNAVDAAIATALCLAVTHPSAGNLGGGGFALVRAPGKPTRAFDFREVAPRALTREGFDRMIAGGARGKAAVGVPGTVAGLGLLHRSFGSLPFHDLVAPALVLARDGATLGPWQARVLAWAYPKIKADPTARKVFGKDQGPLPEKSRIVQLDLARTLERLASHGPDELYRGKTAELLARALAPEGPSLEDLRAYSAVERTPLRFAYRGYDVETPPPPSAGGVALAGILLGLSQGDPIDSFLDPEALHRFFEVSRRAQLMKRLSVVDPEAWPEEQRAKKIARFLDPGFWLSVPIDPARATPLGVLSPTLPGPPHESEHTTHLSVSDERGMVVSLTTTLSASFGAKLWAPGTGIVLNNAVASFSENGENQPLPGRRTTSSMAPTLLSSRGQVLAVLGTPGGDTIPSTLGAIVVDLVDRHLGLSAAVDAPRVHHGTSPDVGRYEPRLHPSPELVRALQKRGHTLEPFRRPIGGANSILLGPDRAYGYADPREEGSVARPEDLPP